jgi:hypothetical protein
MITAEKKQNDIDRLLTLGRRDDRETGKEL